MNAKYFLRQVRGIDRRIARDEEQIERLRAKLESGRMMALTGMPRGGFADWTETADRMIELEQRLNMRIREMCRLKLMAVDAIDAIEDARLREVLDCYYVKGYTWEQVAEAMGYRDVRWIYRLHGKALKKICDPSQRGLDSI